MTKQTLTEKQAKDKVKKLIDLYTKYNNVYTLCPMTFGYGESGHPDRLLLVSGKLFPTFIGIEVKKDENNHHCRPELKAKPNEIAQKKQAKLIEAAGGYWICVHNNNLHELADLLDKVARKTSMSFDNADFEKYKRLIGL